MFDGRINEKGVEPPCLDRGWKTSIYLSSQGGVPFVLWTHSSRPWRRANPRTRMQDEGNLPPPPPPPNSIRYRLAYAGFTALQRYNLRQKEDPST